MENRELLEKVYYAQIAIWRKVSEVEEEILNKKSTKSYGNYLHELEKEIEKISNQIKK